MKATIKKIIETVGLRDTYISIRKRQYKNTTKWHLKLDKLKLNYHTSDAYSKSWFYPRYGYGKIHEPVATKVFLDYIKDDDIVLDIGAHLGYFTCIAAKLASNGKVHAFEVDPKCLELIQSNLDLNNLNNSVINNVAISDKKETIKIKKLDSPNPGLVINSKSKSGFIEVESITIDDYISKHNIIPNFIKIDIEGAEAKALNGMTNLLKQDKLTLLLEIHVNHLKRYFDTDYKYIIKTLSGHGFTIESLEHRLKNSAFKQVDHTTTLEGNVMILCTK